MLEKDEGRVSSGSSTTCAADAYEIVRFVACSACNGEGDIESAPYGYDPVNGALLTHSRACDACDGSGIEEIEVQPVELEDFDDGLAMPSWVYDDLPLSPAAGEGK